MFRQKYISLFLSSYWITAILAAILSVLPYCNWLALMLMALVTLHSGYRQGILLLLAVLIPPFIKIYLFTHGLGWESLINPIFTWLAALVLWRYRSWSAVLDYTITFILTATSLMFLVVSNLENLWLQFSYWIIDYVSYLITNNAQIQTLQNIMGPQVPIMSSWLSFTDYLRAIHFFDYFPAVFTSIFISCIALALLCYVLLAQCLLPPSDKSAGKSMSEELRGIRLHGIATVAFVLVLIGAQLHNAFALQLVYGLAFIYALAGLSLCHWLMNRLTPILAWISLILLYTFLSTTPVAVGTVLIGIAIIDSLFNIRRGLAPKQNLKIEENP
jgi:hypothetical protein